jgi:hypothetical protein
MKVYYDPEKSHQVVDETGNKPFEQIKSEFSLSDATQSVEVKEHEVARFIDGVLTVVDLKAEQKQKETVRKSNRTKAMNRIKAKLGLTDSEIEDLKEALS